MLRSVITLALAAALSVAGASQPVPTEGSWRVDVGHSDAELTTDGTTDFGKAKMDMVLGFARVNGKVELNDSDPSKSRVDLHIYPATSMSEDIGGGGHFKAQWLANLANRTLLSFHSKEVRKNSDGTLQVTGELKLTRVDRDVQLDPNEAYSGPVYGPPVRHSVSRPATFVFEVAPGDGKQASEGAIHLAGSTVVTRDRFPQLIQAVVSTYWPPLVQDENCQMPPSAGEDYRGAMCTGTVLNPPGLPQGPFSGAREDYPGPSDYNAVSGSRLSIAVHMRLVPAQAATPTATGE